MPSAEESATSHDRAIERWQYLQRNWQRRARFNKITSNLLIFLSVTMAVATTSLAASPDVPRWVVAVVGSGTALATALLASTKAQEHWAHSRWVQNQLHAERFLFEQQAGRYTPEAAPTPEIRLRLFSERLTEIALTGHETWATKITSAPATPSTPQTTGGTASTSTTTDTPGRTGT